MLRSMTAYGRGEHVTPNGKWVVEIHSVNRKGLEINLLLPRELLALDLEVRKWLSSEIYRGQVTVRMTYTPSDQKEEAAVRLKGLKEVWESIAIHLGLDPIKEISLPFLVSQLENKELSLEASLERSQIQHALEVALKAFLQMRQREGRTLQEILEKRILAIREALTEISSRVPQLAENYREKLLERIRLAEVGIDLDRVEKEVVFHVDRTDVSEEIERLKSHLDQLQSTLNSSENAVGRTLDFLTQEMGREISTLSAKTGGHEISKKALGIKSEIEKIREQVQNIE